MALSRLLCSAWIGAHFLSMAIALTTMGTFTFEYSLNSSGVSAGGEPDPLVSFSTPLAVYATAIVGGFGLDSGGVIRVNASLACVDWESLSRLDLNRLCAISPVLVTTMDASDASWMDYMLTEETVTDGGSSSSSSSSSSGECAGGNITSSFAVSNNNLVADCSDAVAIVAQTLAVNIRVFRQSVWSSLDPAVDPTLSRACRLPYLASVTLSGDRLVIPESTTTTASGNRDCMLLSNDFTLNVTVDSADFLTVALLQCSHFPVSVSYQCTMENPAGVQVSLSQIPYLGLFSFQTTVYTLGFLFWSWYLFHTWSKREAVERNQHGAAAANGVAAQQNFLWACSRLEWLVWFVLVLRAAQNVMSTIQSDIVQRAATPPEVAEQLLDGVSALSLVSSTLVLTSMMLVGSGWGTAVVAVDVRVRSTIIFFSILYLVLQFVERRQPSVGIVTGIVYLCGLLYAVVQLRAMVELLRIEALTDSNPRTTVVFLRLHSLRAPFGFNVFAAVAAWILQASLLSGDSSSYLRDALRESLVMYWLFIMVVFLRRTPVVF